MSNAATLGLTVPTTMFGRLMARIDALLMTSATISARNGDLPRFGL